MPGGSTNANLILKIQMTGRKPFSTPARELIILILIRLNIPKEFIKNGAGIFRIKEFFF
jgi:hypothetical protein